MKLREIPGHPGYQCGTDGRVFSNKRDGVKEMSLFVRGRRGHLGVNLTQNGEYRMFSVHRLVALAWIGMPPSPRHQVMHLDDDPKNNAVSNLAYGLAAENSAHMVSKERSARGTRVAGCRLNEEKVIDIRERLAKGETVSSVSALYQVGWSTIHDIEKRNNWRHI